MSEIRVDAIKNRAGNTVRPQDVGLTMTGSVIQFQSSVDQNASQTDFNGTANTDYKFSGNRQSRTYHLARTVTITPLSTSSILYCVGLVGWTSMLPTATMGHGQIITRNDDGWVHQNYR